MGQHWQEKFLSAARDDSPSLLGAQRKQAMLFKKLATLESGAELFRNVDALRWCGPTVAFAAWGDRLAAPRLLERCLKVQESMQE